MKKKIKEAALNMLNESLACNPPGMSGGAGNACGADCDGTLVTLMPSPGGGGSGCLCKNLGGATIGLSNSDAFCDQNIGGGPGPTDPNRAKAIRTKGVRSTRPTLDLDPMAMMMREAAKNIIKKNG